MREMNFKSIDPFSRFWRATAAHEINTKINPAIKTEKTSIDWMIFILRRKSVLHKHALYHA